MTTRPKVGELQSSRGPMKSKHEYVNQRLRLHVLIDCIWQLPRLIALSNLRSLSRNVVKREAFLAAQGRPILLLLFAHPTANVHALS